MRFIRVLGEPLQSDRRWLRLSIEQRGAWITLALFASSPEEPGSLADRDTAELLLIREGVADPGPLLEALAAREMIEFATDGSIEFPVGIDWTARAPSAEPEATRERKRRSRIRQRSSRGGHDESRPVTTERVERDEREGSRAGAREESSTEEPSRESVLDYLRNLWRTDPSDAQRGILDEIADRRKAPGRTGWTWISETMQARPDGTDPLEVVKTEDRRLSDEGLARADAEEAAWNETKREERERLDGVPRGRRLVQDPETNVWFPAEEATG